MCSFYVYTSRIVELCSWGSRYEKNSVGYGSLVMRLSKGGGMIEAYGENAGCITTYDILLPFFAAVVSLELGVGGAMSIDDECKGKSVSCERMIRYEVDTDGYRVGTIRSCESEELMLMVYVQLFPFGCFGIGWEHF